MLLKEKRDIKILYLNDLVQPRITRTLKYAKEKKSGKQIWKGYRKKQLMWLDITIEQVFIARPRRKNKRNSKFSI